MSIFFSHFFSTQVTEVKSHSALIQLSFPQDLIHSSIEKTEIETTTSVSSSSSTTTTIATTNSEISSSTTTAASILPTDSSLSSQSRTFLTENNTYTNTTKSCKTTNSPVKSPRHKYKPSALSSATPKMTTTKVNSSKSDLNNGISNNNNNDNNTDECYNGNHESKANSNTVISNTNGMDSSQHQITIDLDAIQFELHLTERCSTPQFKCVFIGEATFISLQDLRPGTNYYVKVCCNYAGIRGDFSPIAHFVTLPSKPNPPRTIQVICQTRNSLHIKWGPGIDNGSRITSYKLEYAQVSTNSSEMGMDKNHVNGTRNGALLSAVDVVVVVFSQAKLPVPI
ncbi:unnamed protein product [Trichobilharzia regenti]|nr:unnamed protein product [Trichobilharzia regenti]